MVTMLNSIGTTKGNQLFVVPFVLHFKYDLNSVYTSEKKENKKDTHWGVSVYVINYYFVAIKLFFVSCEQEPVMPVICVDSKQ